MRKNRDAIQGATGGRLRAGAPVQRQSQPQLQPTDRSRRPANATLAADDAQRGTGVGHLGVSAFAAVVGPPVGVGQGEERRPFAHHDVPAGQR